MSQRTLIRDKKHALSVTKWATGRVRKKDAPFFSATLPQGPQWHWRAAELVGTKSGRLYSLLVRVRHDKPEYKAWLSTQTPDGWALVARYECHASHGGVHCHLLCGAETYPVGEIEPSGLKSFPYWKNSTPKRKLGALSNSGAWERALKFFNVGIAPGSLEFKDDES